MSFDPHALKLYTDGSCQRNPGGASGYAIAAEYPVEWNRPDEVLFEIGYEASTNNRMELLAVVRAIEYVRDNISSATLSRVQIVTDSQYVFDNKNRAAGWRHDGWRNRHGREIENSDLWKRFLSVNLKLTVRVDIVWHKGKKSPILKQADRSAKAATRSPTERDHQYRSGKIGRSLTKGTRAPATLYPANGGTAIIRVFLTTIVRRDGKVKFDLVDEITGECLSKHVAAASPELSAQLHRGHKYRVRFNAIPQNPVIEEIETEV